MLDMRFAQVDNAVMPRTLRASVGGCRYHVHNRGNERAQIFRDAIQEWPYLVLQSSGTVVVMGAANSVLWFDPGGGGFVPRFAVRQTLTLNSTNNVYNLYELDGSVTQFNAITGAHFGNFYYGYVIPGLAIFEGTKHQYPLYDSLAMGIEMMVFTYLLGRTDAEGRNVIEMWADKKSNSRLQSSVLSIVAVVVVGHLVYGSVFAPHLITKLGGWVTAGPSEQLFPGTPNQPR